MKRGGIDAALEALPNYIGGKRRLAPLLFQAIRDANPAPPPSLTLIDAFAGGCSVSMVAKMLGYRVVANDLGARAEAVGKALIENSHVQLDESDVQVALTTKPVGWYLPPPVQLMWPDDARELVAGICKAAEGYQQPEKRWLLRAYAVKTALAISRWGQPRMDIGKKAREGRYDDMTPAQAKALHYLTEPRRVALAAAAQMYGRVSSNGQANQFHRADVLDFLQGVQGDVVYLDPPYPGTLAYEREYVGVDAVLENRELDGKPSRFSAKKGWQFVGEVLDAAAHVPVWVISLGNVGVELEQLVGLVEDRGRRADARSLQYAHMVSRATDDKTEGNREFVVVARAA